MTTLSDRERQPSWRRRITAAIVLVPAVAATSVVAGSDEAERRALSAAAEAAYRSCRENAPSFSTEDTICLSGPTTEAMRIAFNNGISSAKKFVVIRSGGGPIDPAMDIALEIMTRGMDVVVWGWCISSCANYVFLAARNKFLIGKAIVGWHGSPTYPGSEQWSKMSEKARARVTEQIQRHKDFFAQLAKDGIREEVTSVPPPNYSSGGDWSKHFWSYDELTLERTFGVKNVFRIDVGSDSTR